MLRIASFLSVFYPQNCKCCKVSLVKGELYFCLNCELNFGKIFQNDEEFSEVDQLFWGKVKIESAVAVYQFLKQENLQNLIHEFKYNSNQSLAFKMGEVIGYNYQFDTKDIDALSFVPMHSSKERKRGFNQAEKLSQGFSSVTGIKTIKLLKRIENSGTQTAKGVYERFENMEDKFEVLAPLTQIKHVLLIDDVITTGATLAACAKQIVKKGINVSVVCLAYRGLNF